MPNVIKLLIPSLLVDQCLHFCHETGSEPLGKSTLVKVIAESCGASVRMCMQRLDNYLAEGTRVFDDQRGIVDKLSQAGLTNEKAAQLQECLTEAKQYVKGDYKVGCITYIFIVSGQEVFLYVVKAVSDFLGARIYRVLNRRSLHYVCNEGMGTIAITKPNATTTTIKCVTGAYS